MEPLPVDYVGTLARLVAPDTLKARAFQDRRLQVDISRLHPLLLDWVKAMETECGKMGLPFFVIEGIRSNARQDQLFAEKRSKARAGQSPHNYGMAVDFVHYGKFWELTKTEWAIIGQIGKEVARRRNLKLTWGGDWSFYDPAHWELADWKVRKG